MEHSVVTGADYLAIMLHPRSRKLAMTRAVKAAKTLGEFDTVVFTGNSGLLFGPELAHRLGKQMLLVNKPGQSRHYNGPVEGASRGGSWVFADDLISSGATFFRVKKAVEEHRPGAELVGAVLYSGDSCLAENPGVRQLWDYESPNPDGSFNGLLIKTAYSFLGDRVTYQQVRNEVHSFCGS